MWFWIKGTVVGLNKRHQKVPSKSLWLRGVRKRLGYN